MKEKQLLKKAIDLLSELKEKGSFKENEITFDYDFDGKIFLREINGFLKECKDEK